MLNKIPYKETFLILIAKMKVRISPASANLNRCRCLFAFWHLIISISFPLNNSASSVYCNFTLTGSFSNLMKKKKKRKCSSSKITFDSEIYSGNVPWRPLTGKSFNKNVIHGFPQFSEVWKLTLRYWQRDLVENTAKSKNPA